MLATFRELTYPGDAFVISLGDKTADADASLRHACKKAFHHKTPPHLLATVFVVHGSRIADRELAGPGNA